MTCVAGEINLRIGRLNDPHLLVRRSHARDATSLELFRQNELFARTLAMIGHPGERSRDPGGEVSSPVSVTRRTKKGPGGNDPPGPRTHRRVPFTSEC